LSGSGRFEKHPRFIGSLLRLIDGKAVVVQGDLQRRISGGDGMVRSEHGIIAARIQPTKTSWGGPDQYLVTARAPSAVVPSSRRLSCCAIPGVVSKRIGRSISCKRSGPTQRRYIHRTRRCSTKEASTASRILRCRTDLFSNCVRDRRHILGSKIALSGNNHGASAVGC